MAKILFVSEKINETSWSMATALKSQNNEVLFLTSREQDVPAGNNNIQILSYFKKWNSWEVIRLFPMLLSFRMDVVHFVLETDELNAAQSFLTSACVALPQTLISTSLLNISQGLSRRNPVRYLIERSDLVTAPTMDMLAELRGLDIKKRKQIRGVIPPIIPGAKDPAFHEIAEKVSQLLLATTQKPFVLVPLLDPKHQYNEYALAPLIALSKKFFLIFEGTLKDWTVPERKLWEQTMTQKLGNNWCISGELTMEDEQNLLEKAQALFLAGQEFSPCQVTQWVALASKAQAPVIVDDRQTRLYPGLWEHQKNSWVFPRVDLANELERWIQAGPPALSSSLQESLREKQDMLDAPLNELHRLYNRLPL